MLDIARVTRVMQGGKRMSFRACIALGDKNGNIGIGLGKGADVTLAVNKAVNQAKKNMVHVNLINDTIPHEVRKTMGASWIVFKPAKQGSGVKAGGVVRIILELAGVKNVTSKILGGGNKINNARCTVAALKSLKKVEPRAKKEETETK
ncbi:MAG TPA: 30S ribosomal protein S5 [bacterium]|nr:30S ribosomal protein S5 [bacterium]HPT29922.1 30S ribosomal protein S5 [bacterium]